MIQLHTITYNYIQLYTHMYIYKLYTYIYIYTHDCALYIYIYTQCGWDWIILVPSVRFMALTLRWSEIAQNPGRSRRGSPLLLVG